MVTAMKRLLKTPMKTPMKTPTKSLVSPLCLSLLVGVSLSACLNYDHQGIEPSEGGREEVVLFTGLATGDACEANSSCRRGLSCEEGACSPRGDTPLNGPCLRSDECDEGLRCGWAGFCVTEGTRELGEACAHDGECARGASCERTGGIAGQCMPREGGSEGLALGEACSGSDLCAEGLVCSPTRDQCVPGSLLLNPDTFRGVACDQSGELEMPFGVRHTLPTEGPDPADFFATPFPTDLRLTAGRVDLSDYPTPGASFGGKDLFNGLLREVEAIREGWSRNPAIYFRFTRPLQEDLRDPDRLMERRRYLRLIDLNTGDEHPFEAAVLEKRNKYICHNALYMHPLWSHPLEGGHTYAAIVMSTVRDEEGTPPQKLDALAMLLNAETPTDEVERVAWRRYAPLRSWLRLQGASFGVEDIAGATVFTVREESSLYEQGREAVYRADITRFDGSPVLCESGTRSPCATPDYTPPPQLPDLRDPRDCPEEPSPNFHEVHARVRLPIFQRGELPYSQEGGDVVLDGDRPRVSRYMSVCMSITVPKNQEPPAEGWPVMLYAHGTGGRFRAGAQLLGASLSNLQLAGEPAAMAIVGIDQSMHGDRIGPDQNLSPGPLFFNVQNPKAARGNLIQGALDNFALVRFLQQSPSVESLNVEGVGEIRLNPERISYHGHSQGGTTGPLFAPFEDELSGVAFSGTAGGLLFSLLGKKEPYDATVGLRLTLQEMEIDAYHPAMHIFQELFDDVDPVNFAARLYSKPHGRPLHTLHIMGLNDAFTPDSGQRSFAAASGGTLGRTSPTPPDFDAIEELGVASDVYPISSNIRLQGVSEITGAIGQFSPERDEDGAFAYDGHFVTYRHRDANTQLLRFLGDLALGRIPTVISGAEGVDEGLEPVEPPPPEAGAEAGAEAP